MAKKITVGSIEAERFEKAIAVLEQGGTKKAACEALGIRYNTKKLDELVEDYHSMVERRTRLRKQNRTKPVTKSDLKDWIESYLGGMSLTELAEANYRSTNKIKYELEKAGAMLRAPKTDEFNPQMPPEDAVKDAYAEGEMVWSTVHNSPARVRFQKGDIVEIVTINDHAKYSSVYWWDLGCLSRLRDEFGVNLEKLDTSMSQEDIRYAIADGLRQAKKSKTK